MTLSTTLTPKTPIPKMTSASMPSDINDSRIVVNPLKKPVTLFIIVSIIKSLVNN